MAGKEAKKEDRYARIHEIVDPFLKDGEVIDETKPGVVSVRLGSLAIWQPMLSLFVRDYEQIGRRIALGDTAPTDDRMYHTGQPGAWVAASTFQSYRELGPIRFKCGSPIDQVSVRFRAGWYPIIDQGAKDYGLEFNALRYQDDTGEQTSLRVEPYVRDAYPSGGNRQIKDFMRSQGYKPPEIGSSFERQCELLGRCLQIAQGTNSVQ